MVSDCRAICVVTQWEVTLTLVEIRLHHCQHYYKGVLRCVQVHVRLEHYAAVFEYPPSNGRKYYSIKNGLRCIVCYVAYKKSNLYNITICYMFASQRQVDGDATVTFPMSMYTTIHAYEFTLIYSSTDVFMSNWSVSPFLRTFAYVTLTV